MNQDEYHLKLAINLRREAVLSQCALNCQLRDIWVTVEIQVTYSRSGAAEDS
jgi:hypothetical protein